MLALHSMNKGIASKWIANLTGPPYIDGYLRVTEEPKICIYHRSNKNIKNILFSTVKLPVILKFVLFCISIQNMSFVTSTDGCLEIRCCDNSNIKINQY